MVPGTTRGHLSISGGHYQQKITYSWGLYVGFYPILVRVAAGWYFLMGPFWMTS